MLKRLISTATVAALACVGAVVGAGGANAAAGATATTNGLTVTVTPVDTITGWSDARQLWAKNVTVAVSVPAPFTDTSKYGTVSIEPVNWTAYIETIGAGCSSTDTENGKGTQTFTVGPTVFQDSAPGTCSVSVRVVASRDTYKPEGDYLAEVNVTGASYALLAAARLSTPTLNAATVSKGKPVTVTGTLAEDWKSTLPAMPNAAVRLQYLAAGSQTWADVAQTTTRADGSWTMSHAPQSSGQYRAAFGGAGFVLAGESAPVQVVVTAAPAIKKRVKISAPKAPSSVKRGATVKVTGKVTAAKRGKTYTGLRSKVTLQHRAKGTSYWVNVATVRSSAKGTWTFKAKLSRSGQLRVVHKSTNTYAKATSASKKITVRK